MILLGMVIDVKEEQSRNASFPIVVIPSEIMTVTRFLLILLGLIFISPVPINVRIVKEHPQNAPHPIVVILFGMMIEVKEEQEENALYPIVLTLSGMVMEIKEEQEENASSLIVVTLLEMIMEVKEEQL